MRQNLRQPMLDSWTDSRYAKSYGGFESVPLLVARRLARESAALLEANRNADSKRAA